MALISRRARVATRAARTGITTYGKVKRAQGRASRSRGSGGTGRGLLAGMGIGALLAFLLDPQQGRRRRHLARDRGLAVLRRRKRETVRKADYAAGVVAGVAHKAMPSRDRGEQLDDVTLTDKVKSEIFRHADAPKGRVSVNTEHGVVYLRGQLESQEQIRALAEAAAKVDGVERVENLLHPPGTPAPTRS
jgi:osmotically-inducible protein OsmY